MHSISDKQLTLRDLAAVNSGALKIQLSDEAKKKIIRCREYLDKKLETSTRPIYGINTGFGSLYNRNIPHDQLEKLQENLVKSHACGTGPDVPHEIIRLMLFLKVQSLSYGYSGVQLLTVQRLVDMYNHQVLTKNI
jgi:histidine ammonia-lyase